MQVPLSSLDAGRGECHYFLVLVQLCMLTARGRGSTLQTCSTSFARGENGCTLDHATCARRLPQHRQVGQARCVSP